MKLYKLINFIEKYFGYVFFKNYNIFSYNLFDFFLKKKLNKKSKKDFLNNFLEKGYTKIDLNASEFAKKLNISIGNQEIQPNEKMSYYYDISEETKSLIRDFIKNNVNNYLGEVKDYFNNNVFVTNVILKRNFYSEEAETTELYNNFYHNDAYVFTHFKLFVNLMDMSEDTGPTHVYSIAETKEIIKKSNSYKRNNLLDDSSINGIKPYKHMGKKGECFFCFTSQCLHKAGIPHKKNIRDYLVITFCSYPNKSNDLFHYENEYSDQIWNGNSQLSIKLAKPYGYKKLLNLYKSFANH